MSQDIDRLLLDVKAGKPLSFDAIYRLYTPLMESMAKYYCKHYSLADFELDDIRQEAAIALYNAAIAFDRTKSIPFGAYAKVCLRNRILSYIRCFHDGSDLLDGADTVPEEIDSETPEDLIISKESLCHLNRKIDEMLTDFERSVFTLYLGNMSYADMAKALAKPKKSIDNAILRIKAKLRKLLV